MAQLAVAGGGAAAGAIIGSAIPGVGTLIGAQIGAALGSVAGAVLFPPRLPDVNGPRVTDLTMQTSGYGVGIPCAAGHFKIAGNIIWQTEIEEVVTTRRRGKGGGGQKTTTYSYYGTFALGLCEWLMPPENPQVLRIWMDTYLVYDSSGDSEVTQVPGIQWRFYQGTETQLPDQLLAAKLGDDAPAHRGLAYIVFEELPLEKFGNRLPNVMVEMVGNATRGSVQVPTVAPVAPIYPSTPSANIWVGRFACNVAVDHARGRIYEGRSRTTGNTGIGNDELIRVYDLSTMQTIGEYPMGDMVAHLFPLGVTPTTVGVAGALMHIGVDGFLYVCGGRAPANRVPLWKINPDTWKAVAVYGNPQGYPSFGLGSDGYLLQPMQIKSVEVPRPGGVSKTFLIIQCAFHASLVLDAGTMSYVWGNGGSSLSPPAVDLQLGYNVYEFPIQIVIGPTRDDGAVEFFILRGYSGPARILVARYRIYSTAAPVGAGGAAMGLLRDTDEVIDLTAIDGSATSPALQAAWWDFADNTLVITVAGVSNPIVVSYSRYSTFKWQIGAGAVWSVVDHAMPGGHDGRGDMGRVFGSNWGMGGDLYLMLANGDTLVNGAGAGFKNLFWLDERQAVLGYIGSGYGVREIAKRYLDRISPATLLMSDVVEALCVRAGMDPADISVSALSESLRAYVLPRPTATRDAIAPLLALAQADAVEQDDVLVFRKRGGAAVVTIPFEDLIREDGAENVIEEQRAQDADLPRELTVRYMDIDRGHEQGSQSWQRAVSPVATMYGTASATLDLPIPLDATEARTVARRALTAAWQGRTKLTFSLGQKYGRLVPTDVVNVTTRDGAVIRCRIMSTQLGANWLTRVEALAEDAASYALTAQGQTGDGWVPPRMPAPYSVRLMLPDLPLLSDGDDLGQAGLREYALIGAYDGDTYRTTVAYRSPDTLDWTEIGPMTRPVTWGAVVAPPSVPASPHIWDDVGTIEVRLTDGDLDSATALEVLNGANVGALVAADGSAEVFQWRDATDLGEGRYSLSGLLRGRRGTEDLVASRSLGDTFVLLDEALLFQSLPSEADATRYHRAVTLYGTLETAAPTLVKASRGRAERPWSPCQIAGARDGGQNLTITWARRTRLGGGWMNNAGTVPLGEPVEAYEVDVMDGDDVVRTITGLGSASAAYSAAQQTTDFGSAQARVAVRVYQVSGIVGRGIAGEAVV
jgi:hypothetical protein